LHAVACGEVVAEWHGAAPEAGVPPEFGTEELRFRFADGRLLRFRPAGSLFFSDWSFDIFSPDCSTVALLQDHYGPYHLVPVSKLAEYLEGAHVSVAVNASGEEASVLTSGRWLSPTMFEFFAMCCGGAQVFRADSRGGVPERVFFAPRAPHGLRREGEGFVVVP